MLDPDIEKLPNISGKLSHPPIHGLPTFYIGLLSRMRFYQRPVRYDVVVVLSDRTTALYPGIKNSPASPRITLSLPDRTGQTPKKKHYFDAHNIEILSFLTTKDLNDAMLSGEIIISRSGYSTIMGPDKIRQKSFSYTHAGTDQTEYLAHLFLRKGIFYSQSQQKLDIAKGLAAAKAFPGFSGDTFPSADITDIVKRLLYDIFTAKLL